jgi:pilus assembly protein CpaF
VTQTAATERIGTEFEDVLEYLEPIREFITSPSISEVMINPDLTVFVEEGGWKREIRGCRLARVDVAAAVKRIARADNTEPSDSNPIINVRLGDGVSRICIVCPPASPDGFSISIRKFRPYPFTAEELIEKGSLPRPAFEELAAAIERSDNILISGGLGSGKTTLLNVLACQVPLSERICLLEFPPEIQIEHRNKVSLQASDDIDFSVLIKKAVLRLAPDRIILGEVRGEEAFDLLRALNLGLRGSFATIHADNAEEALYTLANLATANKPNLNPSFIRDQVARAIDYVVHMARGRDGNRRVCELIRVRKYDPERHQFEAESLYSVLNSTTEEKAIL